MKIFKPYSLTLISSLLLTMASAHASPRATPPSLERIKAAYQSQNFSETILLGEDFLKLYPKDADVEFLVGLSYRNLNQCDKATPLFQAIIQDYPHYPEVKNALLSCMISMKQYQEGLTLVEQDLNTHPNDAALQLSKAKILYLQGEKNAAQHELKQIIATHPDFNEAKILLSKMQAEQKTTPTSKTKYATKVSPSTPMQQPKANKVKTNDSLPGFLPTLTPLRQPKATKPYYLTGIWTDVMPVNTPKQTWNYTQGYIYRINEWGQFGAIVNYANRFNQDAPQIELNAIPKLSEHLSLDLGYAYANNPTLFSNDMERAELWAYLPQGFEGSIGGAHRQIASSVLNSLTGSVGKYFGKYYINARPTYFVPGKDGPRSLFYTIRFRRYTDLENQYIGFVYGNGTSPDITDLTTVDYLNVRNRIYLVEGQQPLNKDLALTYAGGYEELLYPNDVLRSIVHLNLGLKYRFG